MLRSIIVVGSLALSINGPPPEAFEACFDKSAGDACTVERDGHDVDGVCHALPEQSDLVCVPQRSSP